MKESNAIAFKQYDVLLRLCTEKIGVRAGLARSFIRTHMVKSHTNKNRSFGVLAALTRSYSTTFTE